MKKSPPPVVVDLSMVNQGLWSDNKVNPAWVPALLERATTVKDDDTRRSALANLDRCFELAGKKVFPPTAADALFALAERMTATAKRSWEPLCALIARFGDPRAAPMFVAKLEVLTETDGAFQGLRSIPKKEAAAALAARLAKGPLDFKKYGVCNQDHLEDLAKELGVKVAIPANLDPNKLREKIADGDVKGVKAMLEAGANPNHTNPRGPETALMLALGLAYADAAESKKVVARRAQIVRLLVEHGADPNQKLQWSWDCVDRHFTKKDSAVTIAEELVEAVTPPYLAYPSSRGDDHRYTWIPDEDRVKMRPVVEQLAKLIA